MLPLLVVLVASSLQIPPGRRLSSLEAQPPPKDWTRHIASGQPVISSNCRAMLANDGSTLFSWSSNKTLAIYSISGNKTLCFENVFAGTTTGRKKVMLTDSQAGHFREQFNIEEGPSGKILAAFGRTYVVAVHDERQRFVVGEVHPERRGLDSNRIIGSLPAAEDSDVWTMGSGDRYLVAVAPDTPSDGKQSIQTYTLTFAQGVATLRLAATYRFSAPHRIDIKDFDFATRRIVGIEDRGGKDPQIVVRSLLSGKTQIIREPRIDLAPNIGLRFVKGRLFCWFLANPGFGGDLYLTSNLKDWRHLGPFEIAGLSFDRTLALLWNLKGVWLTPFDKL